MNSNVNSARRSLRFSFGRFNTDAQIDRVIEVVPKVIEKLRQMAMPASGGIVSSATAALPAPP
jgi:cysteine sulfinate desulfinase/cysteine desulfurase-like protein